VGKAWTCPADLSEHQMCGSLEKWEREKKKWYFEGETKKGTKEEKGKIFFSFLPFLSFFSKTINKQERAWK
jgi:hypothetical protein